MPDYPKSGPEETDPQGKESVSDLTTSRLSVYLRSLTYLDTYLMRHDQDQIRLEKCTPNEFPGYWRF